MLNRRIEKFNATLLPYQKPDAIQKVRDALQREAIEFQDEGRIALIEEVERTSQVRIEDYERRKRERQARRKSLGLKSKKKKRKLSHKAGRQF